MLFRKHGTKRDYWPDPPGYSRAAFAHLLRRLGAMGAELPAFTTNSVEALNACPVFDQGPTGACTGHATSCAIATSCAKAETPLEFVPSPEEIYKVGRLIDDPKAPLEDEGAQPNEVWRGVNVYGVRAMAPLADRFSDADPATINHPPSFLELEGAQPNIISGDYSITSAGDQLITDLRAALALRPVTVGIEADKDAIQNYDGRALTAADLGENTDHYVCMLDYAVVGAKIYFLLRQSWGVLDTSGWGVKKFLVSGIPPEWPAAGHFIVDESAIQTLTDIVVADVRRAA